MLKALSGIEACIGQENRNVSAYHVFLSVAKRQTEANVLCNLPNTVWDNPVSYGFEYSHF
jgi:hypothetical protein